MSWKRKLASRKFWVCVCGFVTAMLAAFQLSGEAARVTAVVMALGTLISYILAEGSVDAAAAEGMASGGGVSGGAASNGTAVDGAASAAGESAGK